jgi:hypothetical protein
MSERRQVAYFYNSIAAPGETDKLGVMKVPVEGDVVMRNGKDWRVLFVRRLAAPKAHVYNVHFTDVFKIAKLRK